MMEAHMPGHLPWVVPWMTVVVPPALIVRRREAAHLTVDPRTVSAHQTVVEAAAEAQS